MEVTRDHDPSAPQAAISRSFALDAAGKEQEAGRNGAGAGPPSQDDDILLEDSEDRNPRLDEQGDGRVPIRAPISDSAEDVGDSEESFGSGESFDSTLEGIAASSTTSNEAFASPKGSPDQFYSAPGVVAGVEASSSQQGALMRLNELNSGVCSLDPALISSSGTAEEFSARVTQIAQKNDLSADDTVVKNILDLLIPLVHDVNRLSANGNGAGANGNGAAAGDAAEDFVQADEAIEARPVAKVTAENNDDPLNNSDEDDSLDDEPDGEEVEEVADRADSEDLHAEDESEVHGTQSAQGLRVVGRNEVELEEATTTPISGSESVQNRAVADDGTIDAKTELDEGKVDATTESSAPVHDDRTKTELDEGKVDATTESAAPVHEDRSKSDSPESTRVLPESHLYHGGGDDTKLKIEEETVDSDEKSDTKSENNSLHEHDNILSTEGEKNIHRAEKATEHEVHSDESDKDQEAVSESLNLELQNLQEEESDPQKQKEEEMQKLREKDIEPEKEENQYPELQQHPKEEISESEKSKEEFTEYQEPEAHRAEAGVEAMLEPVVEDQQIDAETGNLCASGSHHHQLQNAQKLEGSDGSDGSDEAKGGLEVTNEGIVVAEPKVAKLNEIDQGISSESDDQKQGISVDSHAEHEKEAVHLDAAEGKEIPEEPNLADSSVHLDAAEGKEIPEEPNLADSSPSVLTPPISTEDAETVDHTSEDTQASAGIELESVKDKGDATEDADEEVATPKDADEQIATPKDAFKDSVLEEIKPSDTGSPPQDSATEPIIHSVKKDHEVEKETEKETEALKERAESQVEEYVKPKVKEDERTDAHGVEDQQSKVEDSASLTRKISGGSESIEEETKLEGNLRKETKEKSNGDLPTVVPLQESLEKGDISALVDDNATASEQFQPAADTKSKNQSSVDPLNGSSVSVSFKEEDDDEEDEDSYWNEKEINDDDEDEDEEDALQSSAALAALVRAVDSSGGGTGTPSLGSAGPSLPARPAGLGRSMPSLEPAPRAAPQPSSNGVAASRPSAPAENNQPNGEANDANSETREKLQAIRVKFLRLAHRLGQSAQNVVVAQVLYRLGLAEQLRGGGQSASRSSAFSFDRASAIAEEQEAAGQEELDFTCTIMLLGKTGVGKSATINSIFDEVKAPTSAFTFATKKVQEITGTVHGIKLRVIDTPGLLPSVADQRQNEKIMASVKRFIKKSPPDIVLYFDRLDMQSRDFGDIPLLRTITDTFGAAIWFNAIVVLTHASSAPPDGPNGVPVSYEMFVAQRSHVVQQTIRQAAGDTRLMNPVSLVENHTACRTNRAGERVLPNGQIWKPQLLLLSFASKILAEANSLLKLQESTPGKPFATRSRVPPLPFLLSSLLQSRAQLKMPEEQMGDEDESDEDVEDDESDDEVEYDELPPFRRLSKDEIEELDKEQRQLYFEELEDREKLFQKKQWKEELRRRKEMKKRMATAQKADLPPPEEVYDEDGGKSAAVPVALPDMALPPSFDSDNPSHRYRYLEMASQWLVRPVLETHGWDHDSGYDGLNLEKMFIVGNKVPVSLSGQITKDKKEANVTLESAASLRHGEGKVTLAGIDVQTMGKDLSYTLRSETRFSNFKHNKTIAGLAVTMLGDTIAAGLKLEDRLLLGKRLKLVMNGGAITGRGDVAYGGTMEISLRGKDYPISRTLSTLGFSVMDWHGDLAIGGNLQSQFMMGKTMLVARGNLNNRGAGQISIRASSSEQFQMALIGIIPIVRALFGNRLFSSSHST